MKRKIKWKNIISSIFLLTCIIILIISTANIIRWNIDKNTTKKQIDNIKNKVEIKKVTDNEKTTIIKNDDIPKSNPYWDYIKMNMINVNINELKKLNNETIGWIQVNGTNINYPVVQTTDNDFYLNHSFDKNKNSAGWVFMDYRNDNTNFDDNTIIYAHGRYDKTMFGTLKNILKSDWYNNKNNYIIKLVTNNKSSLWQVFSVYKIQTTTDYLTTTFENKSDYQASLNKLINRSFKSFNTTINDNDKILTLSTCYNNSEKVVMHAKLIKIRES